MAQYSSSSDIQSKCVEVGNAEGKKWNSSDAHLSGHIPVACSETNQIWLLERHEKEPKWSFHVKLSTGNKLYVTYNGKSPDGENVTLEIESNRGSFKDRYFIALLQPNNKVLLASQSKPERFLGIEKGVLAMVSAEEPLTGMEWTISSDRIRAFSESNTKYVQIQEAASNRKWISANAISRNRIRFSTSRTQLWKVWGTAKRYKFQAHNSDTSNGVYASRADDSPDEVLFESSSEVPVNYREFLRLKAPINGATILQNASSNKYIGTSRSFLEFKNQVQQASQWRFILANIECLEKNGKTTTIFPDFEVKKM